MSSYLCCTLFLFRFETKKKKKRKKERNNLRQTKFSTALCYLFFSSSSSVKRLLDSTLFCFFHTTPMELSSSHTSLVLLARLLRRQICSA
jgi:hypothetical protein